MTADQCLSHIWLRDDATYLGILETLETSWMRRCLARRRWYRLFNAVRVFAKMRAPMNSINSTPRGCDTNQTDGKVGGKGIPFKQQRPPHPAKQDSTDSDEDCMPNGDGGISNNLHEPPYYNSDLPPFVRNISSYYNNFEKLHLISNNGPAGTIFR